MNNFKNVVFLSGLHFIILGACSTKPQNARQTASQADNHLWLEEIEDAKSLDWVRGRNEETRVKWAASAAFKKMQNKFESILNAKDKIASPFIVGSFVYNFWQDDKNVKGLLRRIPVNNYYKGARNWELVIDFDELSKIEKESWVYQNFRCLAPDFKLCDVELSRGGKDASVIREFNSETKNWVLKNAFFVPEAKSSFDWITDDQVLVASDFGEGTLTESGYPRQVRLLNRGEDLQKARVLLEIPRESQSVYMATYHPIGEAPKVFLLHQINFYEAEYYYMNSDFSLVKLEVPKFAVFHGLHKKQLVFQFRKDFPEKGIKSGALASALLSDVISNRDFEYKGIFEPTASRFVEEISLGKEKILISLINNVQGELIQTQYDGSKWVSNSLPVKSGGITNLYTSSENSDDFVYSFESFLVPTTLYWLKDTLKPVKIAELPPRFNAKPYKVEQKWVRSKDGTHIPYFVISSKNIAKNSKNPTLLYGYGGFEISMTPSYMRLAGDAWLRQGGVYVLANIRGGGEFGPDWHQAALKGNRQKAFDDFIAVAEGLIADKTTSSKHLAIQGGSNGGLLVGALMVQRPDLFKAVVCQVPLLDMLRYHKLLAGASWVAEYGNPDIPQEREYLEKISPYQNLKRDVHYPEVLMMTSTKDDRVHPGHARKMTARMKEYGQKIWYDENIEGGHSAAADLKQRARQQALVWTFLKEVLN